MEKKVIIDTDVLIDYLDASKPRYNQTVNIIENNNLLFAISSITSMELIVGARDKEHLSKLIKQQKSFEIIFPETFIS